MNIMDLFGPQALSNLLAPAQVPGNLLSRNIGPAPAVAEYREPVAAPQMQAPQPQMQTPQAMPQQQSASPMAGLNDFFTPDRKAALNDFFTGLSMGQDWQSGLALGAANLSKNKGDRQQKNQTVDFLKGKGLSDGDASALAGNPAALSEYLKGVYSPKQRTPIEVNGRLVDPNTYQVIADFSDPQGKMTSDQKEYEFAKTQGYDKDFVSYQREMKEAGRSQVNVDTGVKLPSGYQWVDTNDQTKGVQPIAGGPATQLPGELAARVGMADNFLTQDLPGIRESVKQGDVTGPIDRFRAANSSSGKPAETYRKIQSGVEVLSRLLSGAGMTQVEIDEKAARYMPTYTDDAASVAAKLDQLEAELKATKDAALRGRGAPIQGQPPTSGVIDYKTYFGGQ